MGGAGVGTCDGFGVGGGGGTCFDPANLPAGPGFQSRITNLVGAVVAAVLGLELGLRAEELR